MSNLISYDPWPEFSATEFMPTSHLLYMGVQVMGKLMLTQSFEPHWANLAMPLTSRGITTGMIPYNLGTFSVELDCIDHVINFTSSWGKKSTLELCSTSVAAQTHKILQQLENIEVNIKINQQPQEMSNPIAFNQDIAPRLYDKKAINSWWRIMVSTYRVLQKFHSRFYGITPRIGLFWGTLDLRDARYQGIHLPMVNTLDYISRNAMDDVQFEVGFSANNEKYPFPSFFAFVYPKPDDFEKMTIKPDAVKWVSAINEFILDYDELRKSKDPEQDLFVFFESSFKAYATLAKWNPELNVSGKPI